MPIDVKSVSIFQRAVVYLKKLKQNLPSSNDVFPTMSLFIGFVTPNVTAPHLERLFADTFDAYVVVRFSKQSKNKYGTWYKSASIEVCASSPSFDHFLSQVNLHGNNTFMGDGNTYKVQFSQDNEKGKGKEMKRVAPRIM